MARRGEITVQNAAIPLARGAGPRYKRRVHSAAQRGWQISGEVVVPAAQSWLGTPPSLRGGQAEAPAKTRRNRLPHQALSKRLYLSGNFLRRIGVYSFARRTFS
jgi:hypothetical protein